MTTESKIEREYCKTVAECGGLAYKFVSPGHIGVPDRLILLPIDNEAHREIVNRYVYFVEMKAPAGRISAAQIREHQRIRALGYDVEVVGQ